MEQEHELVQRHLAEVVEAKRSIEEQVLRATETISEMTGETTLLADKVRAFESFYADRDAERMSLLRSQEEMSKKVAAAEERERATQEELETLKAISGLALQAMTDDCDVLLKENGELRQKLFETAQSLVSVGHELEIAKQAATEFAAAAAADRDAISGEFGAVRESLATAVQQLADKDSALNAARAQMETLVPENADLRKALITLEEQFGQAQIAVEAAKRDAANWEATTGQVRLELEVAQSEVAKLKDQLSGAS